MKQIFFCLLAFILFSTNSFAQSNFRVMFYNTENLFDTIKEPKKNDGEYLPESKKHWNTKKYRQKLTNIAKTITAVGEWSSPALVGMCEVENDRAMTDLTRHSLLKSQGYKYIITDCADPRGIDVALMYQPDQFKLLTFKPIKVKFSSPHKFTRDILHATGLVLSGDTLDVFVCHYPSRRGGEKESEPSRIRVSEFLRGTTDSLFSVRKNLNIIIMGDFNDEPSNKSIYETLGAKPYDKKTNDKKPGLHLYNLSYPFEKQEQKGSHKFQGQWGVLDQIIVSQKLLQPDASFHILPETMQIFSSDFLLVDDKSGGGKRPKRTFFGMQYEGGFSDHLPVCVDFFVPLAK